MHLHAKFQALPWVGSGYCTRPCAWAGSRSIESRRRPAVSLGGKQVGYGRTAPYPSNCAVRCSAAYRTTASRTNDPAFCFPNYSSTVSTPPHCTPRRVPRIRSAPLRAHGATTPAPTPAPRAHVAPVRRAFWTFPLRARLPGFQNPCDVCRLPSVAHELACDHWSAPRTAYRFPLSLSC